MHWRDYVAENVENGRHRLFANWRVSGVWEFQRSDGLKTAHKVESPHCFWQQTVEESMRLADEHIPLGGDLPEGMGSRSDPDYAPLWEL